jgi:hypothetical protein
MDAFHKRVLARIQELEQSGDTERAERLKDALRRIDEVLGTKNSQGVS